MSKKLALILGLSLILTLAAPAVFAQSSQKPKIMRLGGTVAESNPITMALRKFSELVKEKTGGSLIVEVFPNLQLGGAREMFEAVQMNNLDMVESGSLVLGGFTDKFKFMNMPYLFKTREAAFDFINGPTGQQLIQEIADETGLYALGYVENGFYQLVNNEHEVVTPDDIKGMKLRAQESDITMQTLATLGANPTPMSFTELYTALQQKVVAGMLNSFFLIYTNNFHEVTPWLTDIHLVYDLTAVFINYDLYKTLSGEQQKALKEAMAEAAEFQLSFIREKEGEIIKNLQAAIKVTRLTAEQQQLWIDKAQPVYQWFREKYKEPKFDQYLEEIKKVNAKYK